MATFYVDDSATGLDDGTSWADAYTSISSVSLTAGTSDTVLVANTHDEVVSGSILSYGNSNAPNTIVSVDTFTGDYSAGARFENAGCHVFGGNLFYGFTFASANRGAILECQDRIIEMHNCHFEPKVGGPSPNYGGAIICRGGSYYFGIAKLYNCSADFNGSYGGSHGYIFAEKCDVLVDNFDFTYQNQTTPPFKGSQNFTNNHNQLLVRNTDLSGTTAAMYNDDGGSHTYAIFESCKLSSSQPLISAALAKPTSQAIAINCIDGTITDQQNIYKQEKYQGSLSQVFTHYRANGANDGSNDFSWKIESNANAAQAASFFESFPITREVDAGSHTITVHVAGASSLYNDEFWIEVDSPSEEASPTSLGMTRTTRPEPLVITSTLAIDSSSTWTGSGTGTKQKVEVAIAPTIAGTVTVRCYLAAPSTTIYVDPKISTDGEQKVFGNVLLDGSASGGGGGAVVHPLYAN